LLGVFTSRMQSAMEVAVRCRRRENVLRWLPVSPAVRSTTTSTMKACCRWLTRHWRRCWSRCFRSGTPFHHTPGHTEFPLSWNSMSLRAVASGAWSRLSLQELLRTGAAVPSGEKHFRAASRTLSMSDDPTSPQLIEHFGMTLSRLAATLEYNTYPDHVEKRLERSVIADRGLTRELVPAFEEYVRGRAADFILDLDNWLAPYASEEPDAEERVDTGVNVFLYAEPPAGDESLSSADSAESRPT